MNWITRKIVYPFQLARAKYNQRRLNRWLDFQQAGEPTPVALAKAGLTAKGALKILEPQLYGHLNRAGIIMGGSGGMNMDQTQLLIAAIGFITPILPEAEQNRMKTLFAELAQHNWGYVRTAANAVLIMLDPRKNIA